MAQQHHHEWGGIAIEAMCMQDMASYGLAALYTIGDDAAKQRMATTLVETLTGVSGPSLASTAAGDPTSSSKPSTDAAAVCSPLHTSLAILDPT
jgi:hypothetical protein